LADQKISELTALTGANVADDDAIAIVDTSATETKKIVFSELKNALDTATGFVRITGDTMTGALDVQSTITSDALTVDSSTSSLKKSNDANYLTVSGATSSSNGAALLLTGNGYAAASQAYINANQINFNGVGGTVKKATFASNGDISFYEDTGTTAKFFWNANLESLQLGSTTSDESSLFAYKDDATYPVITVRQDGSAPIQKWLGASGAERMRIDSSGILSFSETSSASFPARSINAYNNGYTYFTGGANGLVLKDAGASGSRVQINSSTMQFETNGSEAMRIDSSGNLLVGKTASSFTTAGAEVQPSGRIELTRSGELINLNRLGSDGNLMTFYGSSALVGSIGAYSGSPYIGADDTGISFFQGVNAVVPFNTATVAEADNSIDLGRSAGRFKDLYLSGGVYLGGTGSDNKLDDYEEGTWTPVIRGNGSAGAATYATQTGTYTKVGRTVTFEFALVWSGHTGTGSIEIGGFPFNAGTQTYYLVQTENISLTSGSISFTSRIAASDNYGLLIQTPTGGGVRAAVPMDAAGDIRGVGTYQTA
jgi:hypothetical protein